MQTGLFKILIDKPEVSIINYENVALFNEFDKFE